MKILIGPIEIAGYYWQLTQGFRENGVRCDFVTLDEHPFGYESDPPPTLIRLARALDRIRRRRFLTRISSRLRFLCLLVWFLLALPRYDVIIYGFGRTFLPNFLDVRIARFFKRTIIVNLGHGSEARPPYMNGASKYFWHQEGLKLAHDTARTVEFVRRWEMHATHIIGAPYSTSQFATRPFVDALALGIPTQPQPQTQKQLIGGASNHKIRILHAPSRSQDKGTAHIRDIIDSLEQDGFTFEYRELQGQPNSVVLAALDWADLVIDQMWSDGLLSGFGTEAAQRGCAVVIAGFGLESLPSFSTAQLPPSVAAHPDDFEAAIRELVANPTRIREVGQALQAFVETKWRRDIVALRWQRILSGKGLEEAPCVPTEIRYVFGYGAPKDVIGDAVRSVVKTAGVEGLRLGHRPDLVADLQSLFDLT